MSQERIFRTRQSKILFSAILGVLGVICCVIAVLTGLIFAIGMKPLIWRLLGWFLVVFFGGVAVFFGYLTVVYFKTVAAGGALLRLNQEGFEIVGVSNKQRKTRWRDIESISLTFIPKAGEMIELDYRKDAAPRYSGGFLLLGDAYNIPLNDLCEVMKEWHERYGSVAQHSF